MYYFLVMKLKYKPLCCYDIGAFLYIQNEYIFPLVTGIQQTNTRGSETRIISYK